jgi:protein-disulfide isomerase
MFKRIFLGVIVLFLTTLSISMVGFAQEDRIVQIAIETTKMQMRIPRVMEVKFIEKKESPIPGFYSVKLIIMAPDREIPVIVYVDSAGEKVIIGNLFIKGENVTLREAGESKPRKIDMGQLEIEKSPFRGPTSAKITIVEFSNFQCSFCVKVWMKMKELLERYPQDIKYVFKHFPLPSLEKSFDLSEIAATVQVSRKDVFWALHDFFFSEEGQALIQGGTEPLRQRIEEILKEKGYDMLAFRNGLVAGMGKRVIDEDMAVGRRIPVIGTPTIIINGDFIGEEFTDKVLERYLRR